MEDIYDRGLINSLNEIKEELEYQNAINVLIALSQNKGLSNTDTDIEELSKKVIDRHVVKRLALIRREESTLHLVNSK